MKIKLTEDQLYRITGKLPVEISLNWNEIKSLVAFAEKHKLDEGAYSGVMLERSPANGIGQGLSVSVKDYRNLHLTKPTLLTIVVGDYLHKNRG
jgi:hypothetical protein